MYVNMCMYTYMHAYIHTYIHTFRPWIAESIFLTQLRYMEQDWNEICVHIRKNGACIHTYIHTYIQAMDSGINLFDTAEVYGAGLEWGLSEKLCGQFAKQYEKKSG